VNKKDFAKDYRSFHAWIIEGGSAESRLQLAEEAALAITVYQEDIHRVSPEGRSIRDEAMENLQNRLQLKPLVGKYNVAIIEDAGTMTTRAQNRLLKTLEEPPGSCVIFLLTENRESLLQTIRSRCLVRQIGSLAEIVTEEAAALAAQAGEGLLAGRYYYEFTSLIAAATVDRTAATDFINALENWLAERLKNQPQGYPDWDVQRFVRAIKHIEAARRDLAYNVNTGFAVKNLLLLLIDDGPKDDWAAAPNKGKEL
jgi:DNA polymerase-3 subunit delta'